MKLKTFNTANTITRRGVNPRVRVNDKGTFYVNAGALNRMKLKTGDRIQFHQDEERGSDWYLEKTDDQAGFVLRAAASGSSLIFSNQDIRNRIVESVNPQLTGSFDLMIGIEPVEGKYWPLITASLKK